jgi:hypothetical protein
MGGEHDTQGCGRIVKLQIGNALAPEKEPIDSLGIAMITDEIGRPLGFWDIIEPQIKSSFEGRDYGYFYADQRDGELFIMGRAPDQEW